MMLVVRLPRLPRQHPQAPAGGDDAPAEELNALQWLYQALGPFYLVVFLALVVYVGGGFLVMNLLSARRENVCPVSLVEGSESRT